jgi:lipopolysaccharide export system permease protein
MFFMMMLLLCVLFLVSEFFFRLNEFVRFHASFGFIVRYMSILPPMWIRDVLPIAIFGSVMFTLNRFMRNAEVTAIKSCGIDLYRFLLPVVIFAPAAALFSLWLNNDIVPQSFLKSRVMREQTLKGAALDRGVYSNVTHRCSDGRLYVLGTYDPAKAVMTDVVADKGIEERIVAQKMAYESGRWVLYNAIVRRYSPDGKDVLYEHRYRDMPLDLKEKPEDFVPAGGDPNEMPTVRLLEHIARLKKADMPHSKELVAYYMRFSYPFANVVVAFLGIPLALGLSGRYERIKGIGYVLVFSFLYWVFVSAGTVFGGSGMLLTPFAGAWLGNIVFFTAGVLLFLKIQR